MRVFQPRRRGFTLVELLVAIGIILVLAGLALLVANSGIIGNARTSSGSDRIGGWLMQARAKAQRTGTPCGLRFSIGPDGFIREAQMIEVPEPYNMPSANKVMIEHVYNPPATNTKRVFIVGPNAGDVAFNVIPGDTLSIPATGTIHRVSSIGAVFNITLGTQPPQPAVEIVVVTPALLPDLGAAALTAVPAVPTPTYNAGTFGFIRQARQTFGEPPLLIPDTVAIDPANCLITPNPLTGTLDIVFSPNGEVQNTGGLGQVILWTRNPEALATSPRAGGDLKSTYEQAGEMRLIVVYSKTGSVAVQMVAMPIDENAATPHDPFFNAKDGIASGL